MANGTIDITEGDGTKVLDTEELTVDVTTVQRERVQLSGSAAAEIARVQNSAVAGTEYGLVVRPILAEVEGSVGEDELVSSGGNPLHIGARANANEPTVVGNGDLINIWADLFGRLVTISGHPSPEAPVTSNVTASGDNTIIAAPGGGVSLYICKGSVHNRNNSDITVALRDGTAGTIRWRALLAKNGGGSVFDFGDVGWKLTANTLLAFNLSATGNVDINITNYYIAA